ncbi:MAG: TraB/GumN family protein [Clostridiales bacterium]|nr:TraB/GumN family protein [Clostridiales bacterium]
MAVKKKTLTGILAALELSAVLLATSGCAPETGPGICYRITGGKSDMVILGSIHVGNRDMTGFGSHITAAIGDADVFVFECDTTSTESRQITMQYQLSDEALANQLSPETYARLEEASRAAGIPMETLERFHPWAVSSLLTSAQAAKELGAGSAGRAQAMGVEETVWAMVKGREVRYLETPEMQLEILCNFSPELLDAMVLSGCELVLNPGQSDVSQWPDWWQSGDTEKFVAAFDAENDFHSPELTAEYKDALLTRRNQHMADVLCGYLEEDGRNFFVTVGLYHLVLPDDSVLVELENRGYKVERLDGR